ncbi:transcriptional regulator [Bacillus thuringiensis]|uniref:Transcriptional regulator n=1 Tax=Bacillus thuringiensis TaxID=1428 RepID=A0A9X7B3T9_BACTU|nr:helix-turn-helix transcriptional regulator [Bacillus thuringiensis]PFT97983.1 transcriptional regulator [Bacillus thuringiensis]
MNKNYALIIARKEKNLTQEKLALLMNRRKTTISNWENGYAYPKLEDAFKLASILEKEVNLIFFASEVQEVHTRDLSKAIGGENSDSCKCASEY